MPGPRPDEGTLRTGAVPFDALPDVPPRDQQDLMAHPFFALAKTPRTAPLIYRADAVEVIVEAHPAHGMATINDADVLIWAVSQVVEAADHGLRPSPRLRVAPHRLLRDLGRHAGPREYRLLRGTLDRLGTTVVRTSIRQGPDWPNRPFRWLAGWRSGGDGGRGVEIELADWLYRGALDRSRVLAIDPAYFRLTGGIERWLYRIVRKHAGRQAAGWRCAFRRLHAKSGSLARFSDFAFDLRRIVARQPLPGYRLATLGRKGGGEVLEARPAGRIVAETATPGGRRWKSSTGPCARHGTPLKTSGANAAKPSTARCGWSLEPHRTSGAPAFRTSDARSTRLREHGPAATRWPARTIRAGNTVNTRIPNRMMIVVPLSARMVAATITPCANGVGRPVAG